jgi:hypothetical protein
LGEHLNGHHHPVAEKVSGASPLDAISLPEGYWWGSKGALVCADPNAKGGQAKELVIINHPFYLDEIQKGRGGFVYQFALKKPQEDWSSFQISAGVALGMNGVSEIGKIGGVAVHNRELFRNYLLKAHDMVQDQHPTEDRIERNGWLEDGGFVCGDRLYREGQMTKPPLVSYMKDTAVEMQPKGEFERWKTAINLMLQGGSRAQAFVLLCSFAAPLMRFISPTEGGAIICLSSELSGTGKTTALQAAASVWGAWHPQMMTSMDTANARMLMLGTAQHLPTFYDEIVAQDPYDLGVLVKTFDRGKERARLTVDGKFQKVIPFTWSTLLLCSSNSCLVDALNSLSNSSALGMRVLEFDASQLAERKYDVGTSYLKNVFTANYGHAGHAYLTYITNPAVLSTIKENVEKEEKVVETAFGWKDPHRFYSRTIACCRVAARLLAAMPLLPEIDFLSVANWAGIDIAGTDQSKELNTATYIRQKGAATFGRFVTENCMNFVVVDEGWVKGKRNVMVKQMPRFALVGRAEIKPNELHVSFEAFREWCVKRGVHHRGLLTKLRKTGILKGKTFFNLAGGTDLPDSYVDCLDFDLNAMHQPIPQLITLFSRQQSSPSNGVKRPSEPA